MLTTGIIAVKTLGAAATTVIIGLHYAYCRGGWRSRRGWNGAAAVAGAVGDERCLRQGGGWARRQSPFTSGAVADVAGQLG